MVSVSITRRLIVKRKYQTCSRESFIQPTTHTEGTSTFLTVLLNSDVVFGRLGLLASLATSLAQHLFTSLAQSVTSAWLIRSAWCVFTSSLLAWRSSSPRRRAVLSTMLSLPSYRAFLLLSLICRQWGVFCLTESSHLAQSFDLNVGAAKLTH